MTVNISKNINEASSQYEKTFAVCSLVTNFEQYENMLASFEKNGFMNEQCEYFHIDNSNSNQYDAYSGLQKLINASNSKYVILCHQDIKLLEHDYNHLVKLLNELEEIDPKWAVAGNAGGFGFDRIRTCISDPYGFTGPHPDLPIAIDSLDENFIILKSDAHISPSQDITGFHFYGLDLCMQAKSKGYNAYVIGFLLHHYGAGTRDKIYYERLHAFEQKHRRLLKSRWATTPTTQIRLTSSWLGLHFARTVRFGYYIWKHIKYVARNPSKGITGKG